ncbi:MAG: hypothetical protein HRT74_07710 [Flavobacteriales bacterium]|nr:hypothetical protein [Flavobacteriales bacterium]
MDPSKDLNHWQDATPQQLTDFNNWRELNETDFAINWAESGAYLEPDADYEYSLQSWFISDTIVPTIPQPTVEEIPY